MSDFAAMYQACLTDLEKVVAGLGPDDLATTVPATPGWTAHQVLAHLAGGRIDIVTGRMEGAPGEQWTSRHVAEQEGRTPQELLANLRDTQSEVVAGLAEAKGPALAFDLSVHLADLHEAFGLGRAPVETWLPVVERVAPRTMGQVGVVAETGAGSFGEGTPVEISAYELFRVMYSRRSRLQVARLFGDALSSEQVESLGFFGPRDDDQPTRRAESSHSDETCRDDLLRSVFEHA